MKTIKTKRKAMTIHAHYENQRISILINDRNQCNVNLLQSMKIMQINENLQESVTTMKIN